MHNEGGLIESWVRRSQRSVEVGPAVRGGLTTSLTCPDALAQAVALTCGPSQRNDRKARTFARFGPSVFCYGVTWLTEVPQFAKPSLVPPQVPIVRVNADPVQFGDWMNSLAK
jgi:hypothetical protein